MPLSQFKYLTTCSDQAHYQNDSYLNNMIVGRNFDGLHDLYHQKYIKKKYGDRLRVFGCIIEACVPESLFETFYSVPDQLHHLVSYDHHTEPKKDRRY